MKYVTNIFRKTFLASVYVVMGMQTVFADDTEIFFTPPSTAASEKPNIMFIIDSSGSMGWGVSGTSDSRMEVVQDVMDEVLTNITNVNAGLMRFNNGRPGPVIFPVLDIDQAATPTAFQTVFAGGNDGTQDTATGIVEITSNVLEFNGSSDYVGIRFEQLNIPQGATIISANVLFSADSNNSGAADITIIGESVDSATFLNPVANEFGARVAANATAATEVWTMEDWSAGNIYATPNLNAIVEEIVARPNWCGGNDLMLFFKKLSGANRTAYSKDGLDSLPIISPDDPSSVYSPRIKVEYSQTFPSGANKCLTNEAVSQVSQQGDDFEIRQDGTINSSSNDLDLYLDGSNAQQGVGMVFKNIKVPQGAIVKFAHLTFTANENSVGTSDVNIELINRDSVSSPSSTSDYNNLDTDTKTPQVNWSITDNWITGRVYRSEDITSIVSTVVNRSGWSLDNNMAVFIRGLSGSHVADSFSGDAPKLHIGFEGIWELGVNTIRDDLKSAVAALVPSGGTPISGTYAEAGAYFKGDPVFYGDSRNGNRFSRVSHELSYSASGTVLRDSACTDANLDASACESETIAGGPSYESPIVESCQTSHIVFLTDGSSNSHRSSTEDIYSAWSGGGSCSGSNGGNDCSVKMAAWLNTNDVAPSVSGKQVITTHMIGFGPGADPDLMQDMATAGGGGYYSPTDRNELINDISAIVSGIASVNSTFVTAGVTVNQYNRVTNNDERYFSLFTPVNQESWPGNIKRYKLSGSALVDANATLAIDPVSAEFKSTAQSFWSATPDGNDVTRGGAAEQLGLARKVYTNLGSSSNLATDTSNALKQTNGLITTSLLGGVTAQRRDSILYWVEGYDVNDGAFIPGDATSLSSTPTRKNIGDPLHSQPILLQYNDSAGNLTATRLFVGTNHGFLHALNADNGQEEWAFVPQDLLPRLDSIVTNATTTGHTYGLDGSAALYLDDANGNGAADPGDKVYLYIGQRRGGSSYYALDVSNPNNPIFMFQINNSGSFANLGQTWSKPIVTKMNLSGVNSDKLVMIFGGGYDVAQDTAGTSANTDTIGDNVYIADALDGSLLWDAKTNAIAAGGLSGPVSSMNSVPSDVTAFDLTGDDLVDHFYVTDTKAQVFRFDVDNSTQLIKGGRVANMQDSGGSSNNRRFYYSADVALIREVGDSFIAVSIGSGYRAHPLDNTVDDAFYVIKDKGVLTGAFDMDATVADLEDITSLTDSNGDGVSDAVEVLNNPTAGKKGWYLNFNLTPGEKVLAKSVTFNNAVLFTTYVPPSGAASACEAAAGGGRLYAMNILNGNPYLDTNTDGTLNENDRLFELTTPGIAPQVDITITSDGDPLVGVGRDFRSDILPPTTDGILGYKWKKN